VSLRPVSRGVVIERCHYSHANPSIPESPLARIHVLRI
jgi:hypothetical protein